MKKNQSFTVSPLRQFEGFSILLLSIAAVVFLYYSARTLYYFPVPDSYRWYGDETRILIAAKNLLLHGRMIVPAVIESNIHSAPGLFLGSPWIAAIMYGLPQLLAPPVIDIIDIGRSVSFVLGLGCLVFIGWSAFRLKIGFAPAALSMVMLLTTRSFTFATHSARYDIMTGFALLAFVAVFAILSEMPLPSSIHPKGHAASRCFVIGIVSVLTALTISPYLEVLLFPLVIFIAWRAGAFRSWRFLASLISGAGLGLVLLVAVYSISNHGFSIIGGISANNRFGSALGNLPSHFFSYSALSDRLLSKLFYLWQEAPVFGVALPIIFVSEVALLVTKRPHSSIEFLSVCLFLSVLAAIFFQSTHPYFLIYLLPLAALTFAAHLNEWRNGIELFDPILSIANVLLAVYIALRWVPEIENAGIIANRIDQANTAAVQAAFEQEERYGEHKGYHPLVLAQAPAIHELLRDTSIRVMPETFIFSLQRELPDSIIAKMDVKYIVDYNRPMTQEFELAAHLATPIFSRAGPLLDLSVDYFQDTTSKLDTLTLYKVNSMK